MRRPSRIPFPATLVASLVLLMPALAWTAPASKAPAPSAPPRATPRAADGPTTTTTADAPQPPAASGKPRKPGVQGYVSRGVRSRFCFGAGLHLGVNSLKNVSLPLLSGFSAHFRMSGVAGLSLEYDFNRVAETPNPGDLSIESLHFIPNLRVAAVIYPYRWRLPAARTFGIDLAPYVFGGMGIDTASTADRANFQLGFGLEITLWHSRFAILGEFRAFIPRPSDVEKLRERLQISGADTIPDTNEYYGIANVLFTLSVRFYY